MMGAVALYRFFAIINAGRCEDKFLIIGPQKV